MEPKAGDNNLGPEEPLHKNKGEFQMAKRNQSGTNMGPGNARQQNQQAHKNAGQNFEFSTELGAGAGAAQTGQSQSSAAGNARQRNQQAMQNAASRAGRNGQ